MRSALAKSPISAASSRTMRPAAAARSRPRCAIAAVLFAWIDEMIRHPKILDAIEDLLGPDILCWNTSFFIKEAHDPGFVSWHQDATYWGLSSSDVATAWIAMSPANKVSGCMKFIAGTHKQQVLHEDTFDQNNLLTRGQEVAVEVDEAK